MALGYDDKSLLRRRSPSLAFWTNAFGAWGNFDGNNNAASAYRDLGGFVSGMDANVGGSWRLGVATGFSQSNIAVDARHSGADVDSFHLAGYAGGNQAAALRTGGAWAWNDIDTSRAVVFPGFFEREKAPTMPIPGSCSVRRPTRRAWAPWRWSPSPGSPRSRSTPPHSKSMAATSALARRDFDQNVGYSTLGLRFGTVVAWKEMALVPHASAAWQHAFDDVTPEAALAFASTGIGFDVTGVPLAEGKRVDRRGARPQPRSRPPNAGFSYSGQLGDGVTDNAVKGRFTWMF